MNQIETYLDSITKEQAAEYARIKSLVLEMAPTAEETISYGMPTFKYRKKTIIHFGGFKNHMSLFPSGDSLGTLKDELKDYRTSKGTLQFTKSIPESLLKRIVQARLDNID